jgi:hypothetical protein
MYERTNEQVAGGTYDLTLRGSTPRGPRVHFVRPAECLGDMLNSARVRINKTKQEGKLIAFGI